ncbi:hypothetical protein OAO16_03120 [Opitutales bacterium]|nr:hypothetical protein [Opitutales bacterium]
MSEEVLTKEILEQLLAGSDKIDLSEFVDIDEDAAFSITKHSEYLIIDGLCDNIAERIIFDKIKEFKKNGQISLLEADNLHLIIEDGAESNQLSLDSLKSLTVDQAQLISSVQSACLTLDGLTSISNEVAEILSQINTEDLYLQGLTTLSPLASISLSKFKGSISVPSEFMPLGEKVLTAEIAEQLLVDEFSAEIDGWPVYIEQFTHIEDEAAKIIADWNYDEDEDKVSRFDGDLELNGLIELSSSAAEYLAGHLHGIELKGLTELSDAAAESLSKFEGTLSIDGVTSLTDSAVQSLSKFGNDELKLNGLESLSDASAESLSKFSGDWLWLDGLNTLSDSAAESLSNYRGNLSLCGLEQISDRVAEIFSNCLCCGLALSGLTSLSESAAEILSRCRAGNIELASLTELSSEVAESLSKYNGGLNLEGLVVFPDSKGGELLAEKLTSISFPNLKTINVDSLNLLLKNDGGVELGFEELTPEIASVLSRYTGNVEFDYNKISLPKLSGFQVGALEELLKFDGDLYLDNIIELSDSEAESLSKSKGALSLGGLNELSEAAAKSLAKKDQDKLILVEELQEQISQCR